MYSPFKFQQTIFINKIILTILIPPLVLPAEAPEKEIEKMNVRKDPHKM